MTHTRRHFAHRISAAAFVTLTLWPLTAPAQERSPGFLDNLFNRGESPPPNEVSGKPQNQSMQVDGADLALRLDRMENALRQLTGTIEQLQYRNQQLEIQLKRLQDDVAYRFQQPSAKAGVAPAANPPPMNASPGASSPGAIMPGRRGDAFDPAQHPNAPGAPRALGNESAVLPPQNDDVDVPPVGAPGERAAGAPLDLSTLANNAGAPSPSREASTVMRPQPSSQGAIVSPGRVPASAAMPPSQNSNAGVGTQLATLPPSANPQDEYDLAYGYVLHKDYALAEQAFRDFLAKYPSERLVPDAQYWLGEALFQQQRYREAAESFLAVSTKHERAGKAPDSLLRLGQSLAALQKKEAACVTFAEINRKYPGASASVKRGAAQELKRAHC